MPSPYTPYNGTPPGFRVSFVTAQQSDLLGGWTENFWYLSDSLANVTVAANNLRNKLLACKALGIWMPLVRISLVAQFRNVTPLQFPGNINPTPSRQLTAVTPTVKALIRLCNATGQSTTQWIGGLAYTNFTKTGGWDPDPSTSAPLNALFAELAAGGWGIRKVYRQNAKTSIATITQAGVVTATAHGLPANAVVRVGKVVNGLKVNGLWTVTVIDANTFSLNGLNPPGFSAIPQLTKKSYVQLYQWVMSAISAPQTNPGNVQQSKVLRATEHHIGRVPNQYSGRRKSKAS